MLDVHLLLTVATIASLAFNFLTQAAQRTQTCKNTISNTIKLGGQDEMGRNKFRH
jgi:hypothetical protein